MTGRPRRAARLRVATRGSKLARWQAARVIDRLGIEAELVIVSTSGDQRADEPIWALGGTGVFVREVEEAVLEGRADIAVHSAKDLPSQTTAGLVLGAVPERIDPRDSLVGLPLAKIPEGGCVGTGSARRRAQLAAARPDLTFGSLRGNIETRVAKATEFDAVVVAIAALMRLDLTDEAAEVLEPSVMLPQAAQGALAVECRANDEEVRELLAGIDDRSARKAVEAERAFLRELGGGCDLPCGAFAHLDSNDGLILDVLLASLDGRTVLRAREAGRDPEAVGMAAARNLRDDQGGNRLLVGPGH